VDNDVRPGSHIPHDAEPERRRAGRAFLVTEVDVHLVSVLTDLHEDVMQRLFATGLGLQALIGQVAEEALADRLRQHIADLDDTLDEIRMTLFGLRGDLSRTV
jgi:hypothetical protein